MNFTVGGIAFVHVDSDLSKVRQALDCRISAKDTKLVKYHPHGTTGNLVTDGGESGRVLECKVLYCGSSLNTAEAAFKTDRDALQGVSFSVVYEGETIQRCRLQPNGFRKVSQPEGVYGGCKFEAVIQMVSDE